jgi:hypothetical protein
MKASQSSWEVPCPSMGESAMKGHGEKRLTAKKLGLLFVIGFSGIVFLPTVEATIVTYVDSNVGQPYQLAQEAYFLRDAGSPSVIDFDDKPTVSVTGDEWSHLGATFSQPQGGGLYLKTLDNYNTPQSLANALWPKGGVGLEKLQIEFSLPTMAVGFWVIDSEYNLGDDYVDFYDSTDNLLLSTPLPFTNYFSSDRNANFFIGVISDRPIARVLLNEQYGDNENVGIDDIYLVPEPTTICIFALGGLGLLRRRR